MGHKLDGQLGEKVEVSITQAWFQLFPPLACFLSPHLNLSLTDTFISGCMKFAFNKTGHSGRHTGSGRNS